MAKGFKKIDLIIPIIGSASWVVAIPTAFIIGTVTQPQPKETFEVDIDIPEGKDIHFSNTKAKLGEEFTSEVTSDTEISDVAISVGEKSLIKDTDFTFKTKNTNNYVYELTIFAHAVTSKEISIDVFVKPPVEYIDITFDANGGQLIKNETSETIQVPKGTVWSEIKNLYSAYKSDEAPFKGWSIDKETVLDDDSYQFNETTTLYALYDDHEHEFDSYTIKEIPNSDGTTTRRVCGICKICHKPIELTDDQLQDLEGYVLVKENDVYRLSDNLAYEVQYTTSASIDIYLIYGTYYIYGNRIGSVVQAHLHGVHNSKYEMVSSLDCYNEESIEGEKIWYAIGDELYCDNMILAGKTDPFITWQGGIECNHIWCQYCLITGAQATYCDTCTFLNCDFDSTNVVDQDKTNTDYSVFLYNRYATFHDCNFKSIGKALKIYSHGAKENNSYEFLRCKFTITERVNPKACINVDSSYQPASGKYQVYVDELEQISGYEGEPLYADTGGNTEFHIGPRP